MRSRERVVTVILSGWEWCAITAGMFAGLGVFLWLGML